MTAETTTPTLSSAAKRTRKRILTGDRPTGPLHVGNYIGTLANRVRLQDEYETFLLVADHHMLTTKLDGLAEIEQNIRDDVVDNLAVGVDPEKVTYFLQSLVPQIPELHLYFSMLVSVPRVQRIPTLKDQLRDHGLSQPTYGLLGYPVLQAADILVVKGELVPVGKDQESHVELTREIARRFNELFAPVFPEPKSLIPEVGLLHGIDGREKMGKSLDNAIYLRDDPKTVERKVMSMYTDPTRLLLSGLVLNALFSAVILIAFALSRQPDLTAALRWMMGTLFGATWSDVALLATLFVLVTATLVTMGNDLRMLSFGEDDAKSRGVDVERVKRIGFAVASILTGAAVAVSGIIGFVGLLVPHLMRLIWRRDFRFLLPLCAFGGATLLVLADLVSRVVLPASELPIGAFTAILGVPFFLSLLRRGR